MYKRPLGICPAVLMYARFCGLQIDANLHLWKEKEILRQQHRNMGSELTAKARYIRELEVT